MMCLEKSRNNTYTKFRILELTPKSSRQQNNQKLHMPFSTGKATFQTTLLVTFYTWDLTEQLIKLHTAAFVHFVAELTWMNHMLRNAPAHLVQERIDIT